MSKESVLDLSFSAGLNESVRAELLNPAQGFVVRENVRQRTIASAVKSYGFGVKSLVRVDGSSRSKGYKLFADDDVTCVIDGTYIDVYDPTLDKSRTAGRACEVSHRLTTLPSVGATTRIGDVETVNGHLAMTAFNESLIGYGVVMDLSSGAIVDGPTTLFQSDSEPVVASFSSRYFAALVPYGASNALSLMLFDTQNPGSGWTNIATVTTGWSFGSTRLGKYAIHSLADRVAVAYTTGAGTDRVTVKTYNQTGLLETATVNTSSTSPDCIGLAGTNADTLWVAWNEGTAVKLKGLTGNSLATVKATTGTVITAAVSTVGTLRVIHDANTPGAGRLVINVSASFGVMSMRGFFTSAGAVVAGPAAQKDVPNCGAQGRPFQVGTRFYQAVGIGPRSPSTTVVVDFTDDVTYVRPIANPSPDLVSFGAPYCKFVQGSTSTKWVFGYTVTRSSVAQVAQLLEIDFAGSTRWQAVKHGRSTFLTGALATYFDGVRCQEVGFCQAPNKPTTTLTGTGVTLANGRRYVAVYEDVDADGNWIVSGISDPCANTGAVANKTIQVSTGPLSASWRAAGPSARVAFYATLDSNNGSPPYYRLGTVPNSTATFTLTFNDATADVDLAVQPQLYSPDLPSTPSASLDRRAPPGLTYLVSFNDMLVGSDGDNLYYSGQPVDGEATWFSPALQIPFSGCTGLAAQDGTLFGFKRREVWAISGEIPSDSGLAGGLGTPRRLAVDVGCIDSRSLLITALGIFFQSARGFELLDRAGNVTFVGEPVSVTSKTFPVCTSSVLDAAQGVVYFELAATESANQVSGGGRTLVYDLKRQQWDSTDRRKSSSGVADSPAQSGAMVYVPGTGYRYAWLGTDGRVYVEDQTKFTNADGSFVKSKVKTSEIHIAGHQGEQSIDRWMLLLERATDCDLTVTLSFDRDAAQTELTTRTAAQLAAMKTRTTVDKELQRSTSTAFDVTIEDATPSSGSVGTGQGATWIGLAFPGTPHRGVKRTASAERGG